MWKPRPYQPAYCQRVLELAGDGLFRAEIATELGASLDDFTAWATLYSDFAIALADADRATRAWWDRQAREAMSSGKSFRSALWAKVMAQNYGRGGHLPRETADRPAAKPVVLARYEIPDNGKERRPRNNKGGS